MQLVIFKFPLAFLNVFGDETLLDKIAYDLNVTDFFNMIQQGQGGVMSWIPSYYWKG